MSLHAISICIDRRVLRNDRGVALITTMLLTGLLTVLAVGLTMLTIVETWLSAGVRTSQELMYAADAASARVQVDLSRTGDWTSLLAGASTSGFDDGASSVVLSDRTTVDLVAETRALQADTDRACGSRAATPDCPLWHLFVHAPIPALVSGRSLTLPAYTAAWIADDLADGDGNPHADANGRVLVRTEAFGPSGARRSIEAVFARIGPAGAEMRSWRELR